MPVATKIQGRLGNQLFQFAFIYAVARRLKTTFFIEGLGSLSHFTLAGFSEGKNTRIRWSIMLRYILLRMFNPLDGYLGLTHVCQQGVHPPREVLQKVDDYVFFEGFFQSERYWKEYAEEIKSVFTLKTKWQEAFYNEKKDLLKQPYIALHIRRGDYEHWELAPLKDKDFRLPATYYKNALSVLDRENQYPIVIISDDREFVEANFQGIDYQLEYNSALIDFQILMNARELVISNSTFAWWAGYLNQITNARVLAPKYWLGFKQRQEYPLGIMDGPFEWIDTH
ncbi:MAG: alpha-1,2-fucosyltransferase [Bacteroidota bacterium]